MDPKNDSPRRVEVLAHGPRPPPFASLPLVLASTSRDWVRQVRNAPRHRPRAERRRTDRRDMHLASILALTGVPAVSRGALRPGPWWRGVGPRRSRQTGRRGRGSRAPEPCRNPPCPKLKRAPRWHHLIWKAPRPSAPRAFPDPLVLSDINTMTYIRFRIRMGSGILGTQGGPWDDATNQSVSGRVECRGTAAPRSARPEVHVTVSRRDPRQDRPAGGRGRWANDAIAARLDTPAADRQQVAQALLPLAPPGARRAAPRRAPSPLFPPASSSP